MSTKQYISTEEKTTHIKKLVSYLNSDEFEKIFELATPTQYYEREYRVTHFDDACDDLLHNEEYLYERMLYVLNCIHYQKGKLGSPDHKNESLFIKRQIQGLTNELKNIANTAKRKVKIDVMTFIRHGM